MSHVARALIALLLVACGSSPMPTESAVVAPLVTPSTIVSTTPTRTPAPRVSRAPPTTPTPRPNLHFDGLAQVAINQLPQVVAPEIRDPRGEIRLAIGSLEIRETVFLVDRREFAGQAHWAIGRASLRPNLPLGWVPELDKNGLPTLFPYEPDCPHPAISTTLSPYVAAGFHSGRPAYRPSVQASPLLSSTAAGCSWSRASKLRADGGRARQCNPTIGY